jgi:hypothetical protein
MIDMSYQFSVTAPPGQTAWDMGACMDRFWEIRLSLTKAYQSILNSYNQEQLYYPPDDRGKQWLIIRAN